ncbi:MAG: hypothetical protein ACYC8W_09185 [Candidatus Tyrphobacter sp.]
MTAYEQGEAYERLFQDIDFAPGTCGIVLERARCASDLESLSSMRGTDPTDVLVRKWFASGDISMRVANWDDMYVPDRAWIDDPIFAWWYTAGVASIAASLPQGPGIGEYVGSIADALTKHAAAAPSGSSSWVPSGSTPYARLASVQGKLQQIVPVEAYPAPVFAAGPASYAQLGVYISTIQELVDNPFALSRPESRAFVAVVLAKLQDLHARFADGLTAATLQAAVDEPIVADSSWIDTTWRQPLSLSINTKWPAEARNAFVMGMLIAQVAYNAAVLKDSTSDTRFRGVIATLPAWPGMSAKTHSDIAVLQGIPYAARGGRWEDIGGAATAAVLDIVNEE